jgi:glycosyltransferase involved in cell wall biosynthesis
MSRVSLNWYQAANRPLSWLERWAHRRVDCAIGNCEAVLGQLRAEGVPGPKLRLVYNGIDISALNAAFVPKDAARRALGLSPEIIVLSSVANLFDYKGHQDLLEALSRRGPGGLRNWVLLVAGRDVGNNLARLRTLADQLGLSDRVRFLGLRLDVPAVLSAADIHVSASHYEGFPNNVLEAMCAGLPVIATEVGGVPELVVDGRTGLLVPPRSPSLLTSALHRLASDPERRLAMGAAGRARAQECYTIERSVAAFEDVYTRLACKAGPLPPVGK